MNKNQDIELAVRLVHLQAAMRGLAAALAWDPALRAKVLRAINDVLGAELDRLKEELEKLDDG